MALANIGNLNGAVFQGQSVGQTFNVQTFGAKGDFATDNTVAIQNAIDAAFSVGGGTVQIPAASNFYLYSQLKMRTGVWLRGEGVQSKLWSINSNPNAYSIILADATQSDCWISDLQFHGNKANQTTNGFLLYDQTGQSGDRRHRFWNLFVRLFKNDGLHFTGAARSMYLYGLYVILCDGNSYAFDTNATDNHLVSCISGQAGLNGILNSGANNHYTQCDIFQSGQVDAVNNGDGFQCLNANAVQCQGISSQGNLRHGFVFSGTNYDNAVGLYADSNAGDAYRLDNSQNSYIQGTATHALGSGVGHTSIVNAINGAANCKAEIYYEPNALKSGNSPIQGTATATNDLFANTIVAAWSRERDYRVRALGALAESFPMESASGNGPPATQRLVTAAFYFFAGQVITGIQIPIIVIASGLTLAQSCIYKQSDSTLQGNSNDLSTTVNAAATGKLAMPFSSPYTVLTTGLYNVGFLFVGTTPPSLARSSSAGFANFAPISGALRPVAIQAGQASLPGTATFSNGQTGDAFAFQVY